MNILFIAPLPPPTTGHSLASLVLRDGLASRHETSVVNLSVGSKSDGTVSVDRAVEVLKVLRHVWRGRSAADAVYLTLSESVAGNVKDLAIYLLCRGLLSRTVVHLHGGSLKRLLFDRHGLLHRINAAFVRRLGAVIISGPAHMHIFEGMIDPARIHGVPNFAQDELFVAEADVATKFERPRPLRLLYLSGMNEAKGYLDLAEAYLGLPEPVRQAVHLDFAGRFETEAERAAFESRLVGQEGVRYHGLVDAERKRELFAAAHVFCLPTAMFEGQPISILEGYASGCVVMTTGQPGIADVFTDGAHGVTVEPRSPASIRAAITRLVTDADQLGSVAAANRSEAERRYRTSLYTQSVERIIESVAAGKPQSSSRATRPQLVSRSAPRRG